MRRMILLGSLEPSAAPARRLRQLIVSLALATLPCCAESSSEDESDTESEVVPDSEPPSDSEAHDRDDAPPENEVPVTGNDGGTRSRPSSDAGASSNNTSSKPDAGGPRSSGTGTDDETGTSQNASSDAASAENAAPEDDFTEDLLDGLLGNSDGDDAGTPAGSGEWTLDDGSAEECPLEPPPLPIIGGPCIGIYFSCSWSDANGTTYTCICDWVHWLCI